MNIVFAFSFRFDESCLYLFLNEIKCFCAKNTSSAKKGKSTSVLYTICIIYFWKTFFNIDLNFECHVSNIITNRHMVQIMSHNKIVASPECLSRGCLFELTSSTPSGSRSPTPSGSAPSRSGSSTCPWSFLASVFGPFLFLSFSTILVGLLSSLPFLVFSF